jgi:hypothetical protein
MKKIFKTVQITLPKEINPSNDVLSTQEKTKDENKQKTRKSYAQADPKALNLYDYESESPKNYDQPIYKK